MLLVLLILLTQSQPGKAGGPEQAAGSTVDVEKAQTQETLKLENLIPELLRSNPELQSARKRYEAALARPPQEGALPDPRITFGWNSNGWPYPGAGLGMDPTSNVGFQVAQEFPFPGKRALKSGIARKQAESEARMIQAQELNLVSRLKERFYDLRLTYESMDIVHERQALSRQLATVAEARYSVGKAMQQDLIRANTEISILENRLIVLEQKRLGLESEIIALLDRPPGSELGRPVKDASIPALESIESVQSRALESSPVLRAQRSLIDGRQLGVQSAQKAYYPDFDVMSGYYNQGSMKPMWEFKVQINVPLYFWKKQRPGLEEAGSMLTEAQRSYRSEEQAISSAIRIRYAAAQAARRLMDLYSRQLVPQSQLALESSLASYATGGVDFLTVLSNFNSILDYQIGYSEQQAEYLKALAGLEEIAGGPGPLPASRESGARQ